MIGDAWKSGVNIEITDLDWVHRGLMLNIYNYTDSLELHDYQCSILFFPN